MLMTLSVVQGLSSIYTSTKCFVSDVLIDVLIEKICLTNIETDTLLTETNTMSKYFTGKCIQSLFKLSIRT